MDTTQSSAPQYNIATLMDIARIPEDRIPTLLAELPRLLSQIRPLIKTVDELGPEHATLIAKQLVWVDDGIGDGSADEITVTVHGPASSPPAGTPVQ